MERLDDGVFRALLDRAIGPERAAKAYPAFFAAPTTAIRLNPFKLAAVPPATSSQGNKGKCSSAAGDTAASDVVNTLTSQENMGKCSRAEGDTATGKAIQIPWSKWGRILGERPVFTLDPLYHAGAYYVQDSSAQFVGHVFRKALAAEENGFEQPGEPELPGQTRQLGQLNVLDLCAAPGGKTTDLAASLRERCGNNFLLVANEVMRARVGVLHDNVATWGDPRVAVTSADPAVIGRQEGVFDVIVADVPCSGEGMFRKDPVAVREWSEETVDLCEKRARRIVADVWPALREGGLLVFSTCTFNTRENDGNVAWIARNLGATVLHPLAGETWPEGFEVLPTTYGHLLVPGFVPGEGQYCAVLKKDGEAAAGVPDLGALRAAWPCAKEEALSLDWDCRCPDAEVDRPTALKFLHRDSFALPDAPRGLLRITYGGLGLGFVKNIGTRCNNLLPVGRRIRMDI